MQYDKMDHADLVRICERVDSIMSQRLEDEAVKYHEQLGKQDEMRYANLGYMLAAGIVLDLMRNTHTGKHFDESFEKHEKKKTGSASASESIAGTN